MIQFLLVKHLMNSCWKTLSSFSLCHSVLLIITSTMVDRNHGGEWPNLLPLKPWHSWVLFWETKHLSIGITLTSMPKMYLIVGTSSAMVLLIMKSLHISKYSTKNQIWICSFHLVPSVQYMTITRTLMLSWDAKELFWENVTVIQTSATKSLCSILIVLLTRWMSSLQPKMDSRN